MAKRYMCSYCVTNKDPELPPFRGWREGIAEDIQHPLFRSQRKLARHLQQLHPKDKDAQREAEQLLGVVKRLARIARGGEM